MKRTIVAAAFLMAACGGSGAERPASIECGLVAVQPAALEIGPPPPGWTLEQWIAWHAAFDQPGAWDVFTRSIGDYVDDVLAIPAGGAAGAVKPVASAAYVCAGEVAAECFAADPGGSYFMAEGYYCRRP